MPYVLKDRTTSAIVGIGDRRRTMIGRAEVVITALAPPLDGGEGRVEFAYQHGGAGSASPRFLSCHFVRVLKGDHYP